MAEKNWYYVKNNKQEGPIPESKMQEMFEAGLLSPETLVWSESMTEWTPASKEESFRVKTIPSPPPLPQKPPPIPSLGEAKKMKQMQSRRYARGCVIGHEILTTHYSDWWLASYLVLLLHRC
mgnify:CR=1 FL=1